MFAKPTVLILGAGASIPYGFPSGQKLVEKLILDSDVPELVEARNSLDIVPHVFHEFRQTLRDSACSSIDAFMGNRPDLANTARILIAEQLLYAEKRSSAIFSGPDTNWYQRLVEIIAPERNVISSNRLTIVTFNYDRSLEYYLLRSVRARFNLSAAEAAKLLEPIKLIHVHGSLGYLPEIGGIGNAIKYGTGEAKLSPNAIMYASQGIKVIHEADDSTKDFKEAQTAISNARYVFVLGFGYHPLNIRRLGLHKPPARINEMAIQGTSLGMFREQVDHFGSKAGHIRLLNHEQDILQFMQRNPAFLQATDS